MDTRIGKLVEKSAYLVAYETGAQERRVKRGMECPECGNRDAGTIEDNGAADVVTFLCLACSAQWDSI